jgi:hypothetical protein
MNGEFDRPVSKCLFCDRVPAPSRFQSSPFNGVGLKQSIQFPLLSPATVEIIKVNTTGANVANYWISLVRQLYAVSRRFGCEEFCGPANRRLQSQALATKAKGLGVSDLRPNRDNVRHQYPFQIVVIVVLRLL